MTVDGHVVLGDRQRLAGGHPQLEFDEVDPGDRLGHGVFDLEPGVHLQEVDLVGPAVLTDEELDGAGPVVADAGGERDGALAEDGAGLGVDAGRRGLLDDLLVATLDRALPLAQVDHVAVGVADDLHLDVASPFDVGLDEHRAVAERRLGLTRAGGDGVGQFVG